MANNMERNPPVTTTQRTSKALKAQLFISLSLAMYGLLTWLLPHDDVTDGLSWPARWIAIGGIWFVITKIRIWWNHA